MNKEYDILIQNNSQQHLAYEKMVDTYPARFLSGYTYEEVPQPLRSQRIAMPPTETDVNSIFYIYKINTYIYIYLYIYFYFNNQKL